MLYFDFYLILSSVSPSVPPYPAFSTKEKNQTQSLNEFKAIIIIIIFFWGGGGGWSGGVVGG